MVRVLVSLPVDDLDNPRIADNIPLEEASIAELLETVVQGKIGLVREQ